MLHTKRLPCSSPLLSCRSFPRSQVLSPSTRWVCVHLFACFSHGCCILSIYHRSVIYHQACLHSKRTVHSTCLPFSPLLLCRSNFSLPQVLSPSNRSACVHLFACFSECGLLYQSTIGLLYTTRHVYTADVRCTLRAFHSPLLYSRWSFLYQQSFNIETDGHAFSPSRSKQIVYIDGTGFRFLHCTNRSSHSLFAQRAENTTTWYFFHTQHVESNKSVKIALY